MANYLSRPYNVEAPVQRGNIALDFQVLNTLQSRYDANKAIVDQAMSQYEMLKGLRDFDNEYISAKVAEAKAQIDKFGNIRFEHKSSVDTVMNVLKNVINDPIVKDAIQSRASYDQYNAEVSKLKEKNPDKYNDANYQFGLYQGGFNDYMQGKSNKLGSLSYTPYTDLTEEHLKKIKTINDIKGKRFIEEPATDANGNIIPGRIVRKEIDGLQEAEIQKYIGNLMTSQELQQMKINGWAKYATNPDLAKANLSSFYAQKNKVFTDELETQKALLESSNTSEAKKAQIRQTIKDLEQGIASTKVDLTNARLEDVAFQLEKDSYINGLSEMAKSEWSTEYKADDVYFKEKDLEIKYETLALRREELDLQRMKELRESGQLGLDGSTEGVVSTTPREGITEVEGFDSYKAEHDASYKTIIDTSRNLLGSVLSTEDKKTYIATLKSYGLDENLNWINPEKSKSTSKASAVVKAFDDAGLANTYAQQAQTLTDNLIKKQNIAKDILEVERDSYSKVFNQDADKYVNGLKQMRDDLQQNISIVSDITGSKEQIKLQKDIDSFVKEAGGWSNLKNYLNNNKNKLSEFANLTKKADETYKGIDPYIKTALSYANPITGVIGTVLNRTIFNLSDINLVEDAKKEAEERLKTKGTSYFTSYDQVNFLNESVRQNIISKLPAEAYGEGLQKRFDPKLEFTVYKKGTSLVIEQAHGMVGSGKNATMSKTVVELDNPESASYKEVMKFVQLEESKKGLNASRTTVDIPPSKPTFVNEMKDGHIVENQAQSLLEITQKMGNNAKIFVLNPGSFLTKESTRENFKENLKRKYGEEKAEAFTNAYINNLSGYSIKPEPFNVKGNMVWGATIRNQNNDVIFKGDIGVQNLDENLQYLFKYMPQVLISNYILMNAIKSESNLNTILNGE